jgi:ATP:cob(I)alamin adenosyltransferase
MVHLTRIYTKTGDDGTTSLGDMSRTSKNDPRLEAYATVDEANSAIGVVLAMGELPKDLHQLLVRVQNDLFDVGADLCTPVIWKSRSISTTRPWTRFDPSCCHPVLQQPRCCMSREQ